MQLDALARFDVLSAVRGNPTIGGIKLVGLTAFRESRSEYKHRPPSLLDLMTHNTRASRLMLSSSPLAGSHDTQYQNIQADAVWQSAVRLSHPPTDLAASAPGFVKVWARS